jgi:hypothetical protein
MRTAFGRRSWRLVLLAIAVIDVILTPIGL